MPRRVRTVRRRAGAIIASAVAATAAAGAAVVGSGWLDNDTQAPTVRLSAPARSATVSGSTTVSAYSSDNVGVSGVQFKLDGANLGSEDTSAPFSISWNTTVAGDGAHTLTAYSRDAAGNTKLSTSRSITVANSVANLFIDTNGGTCTRSASPAAYNDATACAGVAAAYSSASLGDGVRVKCGTYAGENVNANVVTSKGSPDSVLSKIVYQPDDLTTDCWSIPGGLGINVPHTEVHGLVSPAIACSYTIGSASLQGGDCHWVDVDVGVATFVGVHNVRVASSEIGDTVDTDGIQFLASDAHYPTDAVIEDNLIHNLGFTPGSGAHVDGIQATAGDRIIVRRNTFRNVYHQDMLAASNQGPIANFTIENNSFGPVVSPGFSLQMGADNTTCIGNVIRYNSFGQPPVAIANAAFRCTGLMYGNVWSGAISGADCTIHTSTWTMSYNVAGSGTACGTNGVIGSVNFTDLAGGNLHVGPGSAAIGAGNPAAYPATDIDGTARYLGAAPDAGAHEVG